MTMLDDDAPADEQPETNSDAATELGFDPDALREKYREERDKRLRDDGNEQYVEVAGRVRALPRRPLRRARLHARAAHRRGRGARHRRRLRRAAGRRAAAPGRRREHPHRSIPPATSAAPGTGTAIPASPATSSPTPTCRCSRRSATCPKEKYSFGAEILEHSQAIARKFDLYRDVCFQTRVEELRWDEDAARWIISTNRGDRMRAHYVCLATGPLNRPKLPGIPGIETSQGHSFHASRWDYEYTGGDSEGGPDRAARQARRHHRHRRDRGAVRAARRRVGRASLRVPAHAVVDRREEQPAHRSGVGKVAGARLASAAHGQLQQPGVGRAAARGPGERRLDRPHRQAARRASREGRTDRHLARGHRRAPSSSPTSRRWRRSARASTPIVKDPETAEALKPYYRQFCKRPCFHNEYLETFNRAERHAGRHQGKGRRAHHEEGRRRRRPRVRARLPDLRQRLRGRHRLLAARRLRSSTAATAQSLTEKWADGVRTLHGMHVHGFPNCFIMSNAAGRLHRELPAPAQRAGQAPRLHHPAPASSEDARTVEATEAGEADVGRTSASTRRATPATSSRTARPATTTTRASRPSAAPRTASTAAARSSSSGSSKTGARKAS